MDIEKELYRTLYYFKNKEKISKYAKEYYEKNKEKIIENNRNNFKIKEYKKQYYKNNRDQVIEKSLKNYYDNRAENVQRMSIYNKKYWYERKKYNVINDPLKNKLKSYDKRETKSNEEIRKYEKLYIKPKETINIVISNDNLIVEL